MRIQELPLQVSFNAWTKFELSVKLRIMFASHRAASGRQASLNLQWPFQRRISLAFIPDDTASKKLNRFVARLSRASPTNNGPASGTLIRSSKWSTMMVVMVPFLYGRYSSNPFAFGVKPIAACNQEKKWIALPFKFLPIQVEYKFSCTEEISGKSFKGKGLPRRIWSPEYQQTTKWMVNRLLQLWNCWWRELGLWRSYLFSELPVNSGPGKRMCVKTKNVYNLRNIYLRTWSCST